MIEPLAEHRSLPECHAETPEWTDHEGAPVRVANVRVSIPISSDSGACYETDAIEAAVAFRLRQFAVDSGSRADELVHLIRSVTDVLSDQGPDVSLQIRLFANPERGTIAVALWAACTGTGRDHVLHRAVAFSREGGRLLRGAPAIRCSSLPADVLETMIPFKPRHGVELVQPRSQFTGVGMESSSVVEPFEPPTGAPLTETIRLLLEQDGPCGVMVGVSPARSAKLLRPMLEAHSAKVAALMSHLEGRNVGHHTDTHAGNFITTTRHKPEDLLPMSVASKRAMRHGNHLYQLTEQAFEARFVVIGHEPPSRSLLDAVSREWHGSPKRPNELDLDDAESFRAITRLQPDYAPLVLDDGFVDNLPHMITREQAIGLLRLPRPGPHGLPGVPANHVAPRFAPFPVVDSSGGYRIGRATTSAGVREARIQPRDLGHHLYLCGKTGVGKSTLLRGLILDTIADGAGVGLLDPHGDLAAELIEELPTGRQKDVVRFDPTQDPTPSLDPLDNDGTRQQQDLVMEEIIAIFFSLYRLETMGPMFEQYAKALLVPLLRAGKRFTDVRRMRFNKPFRTECLAALDTSTSLDREVMDFWIHEHSSWSASSTADMDTYVLSKFSRMTSSELGHRIMGGGGESIRINEILEQGQILIASLPAGQIGQQTSYFLGMLLLSRLQRAAFARAGQPGEQRRPFFLFLDEFQNFVGSGGFTFTNTERNLSRLLSEARKFGVGVILAHQFAAQLDESTRQAILGNVGSHVVFRSGPADAAVLVDVLNHDVTRAEIQAAPLYTAFASVMHDGVPQPPFTLETIPPGES